jgi:hypothetical protein
MATTGVYVAKSFEAGVDLSAAKWKFVTLEADGQVDLANADAEAVLGVALTNPDTVGQAVSVATSGVVKVYAGGTVTAGDELAVDASGDAVEKSTSSSATAVTAAIALSSAVDGDIFEVQLVPMGAGNVTNES